MEAIGIVALVAVVLTAVGAVFAIRGLRELLSTRRFVASSASATGTVTDSVGRWYRNPGDEPGVSKLSHPVVRFVTGDGRTVEFESQAGSNLAPKVGQQVTVLYDPLRPQEAKIGSFMMLWALPAIFAALLSGCEGGTISNHSQTCTSSGGFLQGRTVACSGEAQSLGGSVGIEFGDADEEEEEELSGTYRLTAEISVDRGEARVYSYDADGERLLLGTVSAGTPVRVTDTVIEPFNESSVFFVDAGEDGTVEGLRYEGTIEPL